MSAPKLWLDRRLYRHDRSFYTSKVTSRPEQWPAICVFTLLFFLSWPAAAQQAAPASQNPAPAPASPPGEAKKETEDPQLPFQIQLLETHIRFESNGDSRKEVHTIVKINNILGAREFSRLTFDYNRAFQQIEIPLVRISHANGGTSELLPSATADVVNPAVEKFKDFQDMRVKSVRILGLQDNDTVEYRVITITTHHPLAPDFSLEHTFDRSGQVLDEDYALDVPDHLNSTDKMAADWQGPPPFLFSSVPATNSRNEGDGQSERSIREWKISSKDKLPPNSTENPSPDIILSTFLNRPQLLDRIASQFPKASDADSAKFAALPPFKLPAKPTAEILYDWVSRKIATVDVPLGGDEFHVRPMAQIIESAYGTPLEKCVLLARLLQSIKLAPEILLFAGADGREQFPRPSSFDHVFVGLTVDKSYVALDPGLDVAPFGAIALQFRGKSALTLAPHGQGDYVDPWVELPKDLPFHSFQRVTVDATIRSNGALAAKVKYVMRGDNELLLRVAFHQSAHDKWKDIANLLAISDGFRGQVASVNASDPLATKEPFTLEYEIDQPRFLDWSKKPLRIPALLPQIGVPDPQVKPGANKEAGKIELGTPLNVDTRVTIHLPAGTTAQTPPGSSVTRDYATFASKYSAHLNGLTASRRIDFLSRELPADRLADYTAFFRAAQNDQAQFFTLIAPASLATPPAAAPKTEAPAQKQKSSP